MGYQGKVHGAGPDGLVIEPGGFIRFPVVVKSDDFSLTPKDSGTTFIIDGSDKTAALPPTASGVVYTFVVKTLSAATGFRISPNAADAIHGAGLTSADDKDLINPSVSDAEGDTVTLIGDGVDGWWITSHHGIWSKEP